MRKPHYEIVSEDQDCVLIKDLGPWSQHPTVTNAAEEVVEQLVPMLNGRRLEYYDSEGQRDQLLVKDGKFAGFAPARLGRVERLGTSRAGTAGGEEAI